MKKFARAIASGVERITWLSGILSQVALVGLLLMVSHEVIVRYIFDNPTVFSIEISEYLLVFVALMCAGCILRDDRHIRMPVILELLPKKVQLSLDILTSSLVFIFCAILVWKGGYNVYIAYNGDYHSSSLLDFPLWIPYSIIPVSGFVLGAQYLVKISGYLQALRAPEAKQKQ